MFLIGAVTQLFLVLVFCCLANATRQPWAQDDEKDEDDEDDEDDQDDEDAVVTPLMGQGEKDNTGQHRVAGGKVPTPLGHSTRQHRVAGGKVYTPLVSSVQEEEDQEEEEEYDEERGREEQQ